jgi:uncharacterized protein (UPF0332 family)
MDLKQLLNQGRLKPHETSKEEIHNLLKLIKRDIKDSKIRVLSADRRYSTAYNAILQSATILLYCKGYRPKGIGHHFIVFEAMKEILSKDYHELADYFDSCRAKRNVSDYSCANEISEAEADELIKEAEAFLEVIIQWLKANYLNIIENS